MRSVAKFEKKRRFRAILKIQIFTLFGHYNIFGEKEGSSEKKALTLWIYLYFHGKFIFTNLLIFPEFIFINSIDFQRFHVKSVV